MNKKVPHIYKSTKESLSTTGFDWGYRDDYDRTSFDVAWERQVLHQSLTSPLDIRARDFAVFYFAKRSGRSMSYAAKAYGIDRETASRRIERIAELGWIIEHDEPLKAGEATLPRVYSRIVFWSTNYWEDAGRIEKMMNGGEATVAA